MYKDLIVDQGADFSVNLDLKHEDHSPVNVAGYVFASSLAKSYYTANVSANLTVTVANAALGNLVLSLNAATTSNIAAGAYYYDVKARDTANVTTRIQQGIITVTPQVTR
jgi:hypothetical protein